MDEVWRRHSNDCVEMQKYLRGLYPDAQSIEFVPADPPNKGSFVHVYDKTGLRVDARWVKIRVD
jgi:sporulation-control protein spo0M